jgi:3'-5' exonuclease
MPFGLKSAESADGALSFKARKKSSWHGPVIITLIDPPGGRSPALQSDLRKTVSAGDAFLGSEVNAVSMVSFAQTAAKRAICMKPSVIVWDLETVPDLRGFAAANDLVGQSDAHIRAALGNKFPKHIYHTIVCIGALVAHRESDYWALDALGAPHVGERTEKQLIATFCDKIAELKPQLVTFNGNSFDLPVLRYRAMIHGVSAPGLAARLYFNRYTEDAVDLCDILSSFAPHTKASLNELSKIMGLPGKPEGIDGAEVERYFLEGKIKEIADYCETDVVNTYRVWLRYELFRGRLTESEHQVSERSLAEFIASRLNRAPHSHRAPEVAGVREEGLHRASAPAGKASIDTWVADLLDTPEKTRAASLYELLLRLNLNVSHLDEAREAYVRRLGLR